jgi:hypothetical protein
MIEQRTESLTTADLASAGAHRNPDPGSEPQPLQREVAPMAAQDTQSTGSRDSAQGEAQSAPLFSPTETQGLRSRWDTVQTGFVDEPRRAVEQADGLVAEVMRHLAEAFADERARLEGQWGPGDNISTEDLRVALRRYRSFFDRLLRYGAHHVQPPEAARAGSASARPSDEATPVQRAAIDRPGETEPERQPDAPLR